MLRDRVQRVLEEELFLRLGLHSDRGDALEVDREPPFDLLVRPSLAGRRDRVALAAVLLRFPRQALRDQPRRRPRGGREGEQPRARAALHDFGRDFVRVAFVPLDVVGIDARGLLHRVRGLVRGGEEVRARGEGDVAANGDRARVERAGERRGAGAGVRAQAAQIEISERSPDLVLEGERRTAAEYRQLREAPRQ
jgi:hypothetical protein